MKKTLLFITISTVLFSSPAIFAQTGSAAPNSTMPTAPVKLSGRENSVPPANKIVETAPGDRSAETDKSVTESSPMATSNMHAKMMGDMGKMDGTMMKMEEAMKKIDTTKDGAERKKLIEEHMVAMHAHMASMKDMLVQMKQM